MSAKENKDKGRQAFKEEKWEEAIDYFNKALEEDPKDVICLAVRSSAHQKAGDLTKALADATACTEIKPTYARGHFRKACVHRAMKDYEAEVATFESGIEQCPADDSLQKGLQMAKRLLMASSKATQAALTTQSTRDAALSRSYKANKSKDLASFVEQQKMNLQLQMVALQAQLDLVREIDGMQETDKIDLLYNLLMKVHDGTITTKKLSESLKEASSSLSFVGDIHKALDDCGEADDALSRETFESYVKQVTEQMAASVGDFAEFVVYQVLFTGIAQAQQLEEEKMATLRDMEGSTPDKSILNDKRMQSLFVLFDKDADATVGFKEVAIGLYQLTKSMEEAKKNAASLLLMMDKDDKRVLSYEQFAKLIMGVAASMDLSFDELADQLTYALANSDDISDEVMAEILVAEEVYGQQREREAKENQRKKTLDALSYSRTQKLFDLWDADGDGTIDFQELMTGLRKYQKAGQVSVDVERAAVKIMGHDEDSNQALDKEEFAYAMADYAEAISKDLHELIDFMCVVSSQSDTSHYETAYTNATIVSRTSTAFTPSRFEPGLGTILDMGADEDSEAEDDW